MNRPRVLHVTTVHAPFDNRIFGMEAKSLADAGFDVTLATTVDRPGVRDGVNIVPVGALGSVSQRSRRIGRNMRAFYAMQKPYDIVHVHDPELLVPAGLVQRLFGRAIVYDVHEFYDEKFGGGDATAEWIPGPLLRAVRAGYRATESVVLPRAAGIVVVSEPMIERYLRYLPPDRIALVQNYPNLADADIAEARNTLPPIAGPYVVHTGGASKNRSFEVMVAAAETLRARGIASPLVNVGPIQLEGYPDAGALLQRAEAAGIVMTGSLSHKETLRWIAHAAIGYQPIADNHNNRRGQPRKLFEYVLFGLPVVSSDVGNIGKLVRDFGVGLTVPVDDGEAHALALQRLLENPAVCAHYAANARNVAPSFSFATQLPNLITLYTRILGASPISASIPDLSAAESHPVP